MSSTSRRAAIFFMAVLFLGEFHMGYGCNIGVEWTFNE